MTLATSVGLARLNYDPGEGILALTGDGSQAVVFAMQEHIPKKELRAEI